MPHPVLQAIIGVWKTITPNKFIYSTMHIYSWQIAPNQAYMPAILLHQTWHISWQIYIYRGQCTFTYGRLTPLQSSIDLCKTITPHKFLYSTMHIYPWQIALPAIEHRCLEYHYTKCGTSNGISLYI